MRKSQLLIILTLLGLLVIVNQLFTGASSLRGYLGGLSWYGWVGMSVFLIIAAVWFAFRDARRARRLLEEPAEKFVDPNEQRVRLSEELLQKYDPRGPEYPHPVIISERCIGCHACVEACPHDVLAMVNNLAVPVAREQCLEDTSCQVVCPVTPKACIVVNTLKVIKPRPVPMRDEKFMTNVPGCYIVGDVSGTPLIKNAVNEGADVIKHIAQELKNTPPEPSAEFEVAIVGIGPGGLSAAVLAKQHNLKYIGIERDEVLSTIVAYPKNKYLFLKPESMPARGGIMTDLAGDQRERLLESWTGTMMKNDVVIHEREECKAVKRAADGDYFTLQTEKVDTGESSSYRARRVVLALGTRGAPMKLKVPGEEMKISANGQQQPKVSYVLSNADDFKGKRIIIVGGGNAAIEAAVDLVARRNGDQIEFRPPDEMNDVTLLVRSDFKNDVKFGNKQQIYQCMDEGKVKAYFGAAIKEIHDDEVVVMDVYTKTERARLANDYILALIGGAPPSTFLESIGITIPKGSA